MSGRRALRSDALPLRCVGRLARLPPTAVQPLAIRYAHRYLDVITGATGNCWAIHTNCPVPGPVPTSPANNDFKPGFATALMNKDIGLAMDAVKSTGSSAPLGSHAAEIYAKFAADHADKDFSAIIEMIRKG
jgi:3-hydroxyisobutyrate dehydrogenase